MRNFSDKLGRTRISAFGVLEVRRRLKSAENTAYREKGHLGMEIEDHFRYGHSDFSGIAQGVSGFLLKHGHLAVKRRAVKFKIALAAATSVKGFASRSINRVLPGLLVFVGDAVQPADHGTIRIQNAQIIKIKRAHQPHDRPAPIGSGGFINHV